MDIMEEGNINIVGPVGDETQREHTTAAAVAVAAGSSTELRTDRRRFEVVARATGCRDTASTLGQADVTAVCISLAGSPLAEIWTASR
ncbi:hypothetical protein ElyMa_004597200 [Elysia marginata]|uniref:Uncharacterized protein n=1 Tax=Elysia marginata TaxID=1093978 RepID=A0AAV4HZB9_9GAST|nr:hypothetical protein ElyMa_004597200 [Elysia marginata]